MKTLLFVRHGKTKYTGVFPDLTDEGVMEIHRAAKEILDIVRDSPSISFITSPTERAFGTMSIIAEYFHYHRSMIHHEPAIRCMDFYDEKAANALWAYFGSARDVDRAYLHNPRFEEGVIVEKRSAIRNRFFGYLGGLFEQSLTGELRDFTIHASHYEVLSNLAVMFGFKEPLIHGEVIKLELTKSVKEGRVHVRATFREYSREFDCKLPSALFASQFIS